MMKKICAINKIPSEHNKHVKSAPRALADTWNCYEVEFCNRAADMRHRMIAGTR